MSKKEPESTEKDELVEVTRGEFNDEAEDRSERPADDSEDEAEELVENDR